ncbi:S8 family serine peptidase [Streptomyces cyslabdanicus]|uniref:S8 family serine peptidase n=1 Tax=Streptomyces cyslabdanicus TaxID=1470456 RepID=UPI0040450356
MAHLRSRRRLALYGSLQGMSTAAPHVAGVAALPTSTRPNARPAQLPALLKTPADTPGCPAEPHDADGDGVVDSS